MLAPLAITTSDPPRADVVARAKAAAAEVGAPFVARSGATLASLMDAWAPVLVVFEAASVTLVDRVGVLRFSPGLAHLRIKQLDRGVVEDLLLSLSGLAEGDSVLDCTLGLGADAQVAARRVGPSGSVVALENSPSLYVWAKQGLSLLPPHPRACPIQVVHAEAGAFLKRQATGAFDYVFFDPMFERKRKSSHAFEALRRHADHAPMTPEMVHEARRVARKAVMVKASRYSEDLRKLGLTAAQPRPSATVVWGRVPGSAD